MSTTKYTLHYLSINAKGNCPRAIFNYTKTPFTNITYSFDEFAKIKNSNSLFEYTQVPILELTNTNPTTNTVSLSQSIAINTYLSKQLNLLGNNDFEMAQVISIFNSYDEFWTKFRPIFKQLNSNEVENKEKIKEAFFNTNAEKYLKIYERRLIANNNGKFLIGNSFTGADIWLTCILYNMFKLKSRKSEYEYLIQKHSPKLDEYVDSISSNQLNDYFNNENNKFGFNHDSLI